jgi:RNA polymerase sigma-70 factor (ECF subfamily)
VNRKEYNKAVKDLSDKLYAFAVKWTGNEDVAKDMIQDAYEKLWINIDKVTAKNAKSFLYKTVYHQCVDLSRKQKVKMRFENEIKHNIIIEPENEFFDMSSHLDKALTALPDIQRTVLLLRDLEGYSYNEIGEITGLNESQVKVYIYRARISIKNFFEKLEKVK